ncbi:hypothetical protein ACFOLC_06550 [Lysobacter cavernae]|uniref:AttH domain-containing protein n=1 Tax=Lysobacter cavernae TaxID=1685901 RepID=A0ABV7RMS7_9GAMM
MFEWWYSDVQLADGTTIVCTASPQASLGFVPQLGDTPMAVARIQLHENGVQRNEIATFPTAEFKGATDHCDIVAGPVTMQGDLKTWRVKGTINGLGIDLTFEQEAMPFRPGSGYFFAGSTERFTGWFWARPSFDRYVALAVQMQFRDRVTAPLLWVYDLQEKRELVRAFSYDELTLATGRTVEHPDPLHGEGYPSITVYDYRKGRANVRVRIDDQKVIAGFFVYDISNPAIQQFLKGVGYNGAYYTRRASTAELILDLPDSGLQDRVTGSTLHELQEFYFPQYLLPR